MLDPSACAEPAEHAYRWKTVLARTGRSWDEWYALLDALGGRTMSHREMTRTLEAQGLASGWWCQAIVTNYERSAGLREVGQTCRRSWAASARTTCGDDLDGALAAWITLAETDMVICSAAPARAPTVTGSAKFRYWRAALSDGTRIDVTISRGRTPGTAAVAVKHDRLEDAAAVAQMRNYWKARLAALGAPRMARAATSCR